MAALTVATARCPACGAEVTLPGEARLDPVPPADSVIAYATTEPGTFYTHVRDAHPGAWRRMCARQEARNVAAARAVDSVPRKVDGSVLLAGEDVGDI